ncbi:MAG TPA: hypothetical protein VF903_08745 [Nitrospirota bacterium]
MCIDHSAKCFCGKNHASFHFKDDILPFETVTRLYCPSCSIGVPFDPVTMIGDNGWLIVYDMDVARFLLQRAASARGVTPEFIFDEGYCTWRGITPTDHIDSLKEREGLLQLAKTDRKRYFEEIRSWGIKRMERLARAGWRRASQGEPVQS